MYTDFKSQIVHTKIIIQYCFVVLNGNVTATAALGNLFCNVWQDRF